MLIVLFDTYAFYLKCLESFQLPVFPEGTIKGTQFKAADDSGLISVQVTNLGKEKLYYTLGDTVRNRDTLRHLGRHGEEQGHSETPRGHGEE